MTDLIRMTGLLAALQHEFPCFGFQLQRSRDGMTIAAVRESGAGTLHTLVTGDPDELRAELATADQHR